MLNFLIRASLAMLVVFGCFHVNPAQDKQKSPIPAPTVEILNDEKTLEINTNLIQTGVTVFDKKGQFINDLKQDDFELIVDGKPVSVSFFERIGKKINSAQTETKEYNQAAAPGRNLVFVVDDLHLSPENTNRVRKLIGKFIDQDMRSEDTMVIVATSGKIGFLQQFTNNRTVLKTAAEKITYNRNYSADDKMPPPMTEYEAHLVNHLDSEIIDYFISLDRSPGDAESKREIVRARAREILSIAATVSRETYSVLNTVVRSSASLPGRKTVFFISDGFLPDTINADYAYRMKLITDAASRANAVIYTIDSRGLDAGLPEGGSTSSNTRLGYRVQSGQRSETQSGLNELAESTGGRFSRNTNDMQAEIENYLNESSSYYLLAWEAGEEENPKANKKPQSLRKIEVNIKSRPDLKIRFQSGYFAGSKDAATDKVKEKPLPSETPTVAVQLNQAIKSRLPMTALPTMVSVNYQNLPGKEALMLATLQIDKEFVGFTDAANNSTASIDILGILYNAEGKQQDTFRKLLAVDVQTSRISQRSSKILFSHQVKVKPGLYQLRIATRDTKSGRVGSQSQWIEIPDISAEKLALSSILVGEIGKKDSSASVEANAAAPDVQISVDRIFEKDSTMYYQFFLHNSTASQNITVQTKVLREKDVMLETPARKFPSEGQDSAQLFYAAQIPLNKLLAGRYILEITVSDQTSGAKSSQKIDFEVR